MLTTFLIAGLLAASTLASLLLLTRTIWALDRFAYRPTHTQSPDLPSISVCIAARNEMHALAQCLERALKSDYVKIEVLVLDDSSDDDTSLIIKSFANAGVRFIPGKSLPQGWLGKNHAYQTLIDEASGDYILFLDVDTTIRVNTISQLVDQLLANQKSMVSVLPRRQDSYRASAVFGTLRYYWELLLATRQSPPAASALWMVEKAKLEESGIGLTNYGMSVRPERHLARQLQRTQLYYYLIGTDELGVGFEKRLSSQHETALRLYYAMSGKSIVNWIAMVLFLILLLAPLPLLLIVDEFWLRMAALTALIIATFTFRLYFIRTNGKIARRLRLFLWPVIVLYEVILLTKSYLAYRLGTVTWKGRAVNATPNKQDDLRIDE